MYKFGTAINCLLVVSLLCMHMRLINTNPIQLRPRSSFLGRGRWQLRRKPSELPATNTRLKTAVTASDSSSSSHTTRQRRSHSNNYFLTSRTGYNLAINAAGNVYATHNSDPNAVMEHRAVDMGLVVWRGVASGRYLAFDEEGHLRTTSSIQVSNYFIERYWPHGYYSYGSQLFHQQGWFLGVNDRGQPINGRPHRLRHRRNVYPRYEEQFLLRQANN